MAELHQTVRELHVKMGQGKENAECQGREAPGDHFRDQGTLSLFLITSPNVLDPESCPSFIALPILRGTMQTVVDQLKDTNQRLPETLSTQIQASLATVKQDLHTLSADTRNDRTLGDGLKVSPPYLRKSVVAKA